MKIDGPSIESIERAILHMRNLREMQIEAMMLAPRMPWVGRGPTDEELEEWRKEISNEQKQTNVERD